MLLSSRCFTTLAISGLLFILAGCGGTPDKNPLLEKAENHYQQAEQDSVIVTKAPVALKEAEEQLTKSRQLWKEGADKELVTHYAYMANQKVAIARQTARLNAAQDEVERAQTQRQKVLIQARKAEAEQAERRAQKALQQAREERQKAQELSEQLNNLKAKSTERGMVLTLGDVLFDFDKASLKPGGFRVVDRLSNFLKEYKDRNIRIEGFTDSVGGEEYNRNLSRRRAVSVRDALLDQGISNQRISIRGYGEQYPVASNSTEAGRQQNRRVEVIISDKSGDIPERGQ